MYSIKVPEGVVNLKYWEATLDIEEKRGIKRCFTLTRDHLDPSNYQKMNVRMAMRVRFFPSPCFFVYFFLSCKIMQRKLIIYLALPNSGFLVTQWSVQWRAISKKVSLSFRAVKLQFHS